MKQYSVQMIAKELNISKNALRYYDKIQLLSPIRGDNNYRYYTEQDRSFVNDSLYIIKNRFPTCFVATLNVNNNFY